MTNDCTCNTEYDEANCGQYCNRRILMFGGDAIRSSFRQQEIDSIQSQLKEKESRIQKLTDVLKELVELNELKEMIKDFPDFVGGDMADAVKEKYQKEFKMRKPLAWQAAKSALKE